MTTKEKQHSMDRVYTKEEINQVSQLSILQYIEENGLGIMEGKGRYLKCTINGHSSVVIDQKKNYFIHNGGGSSKGSAGNLIRFVQYFEGLSFREAVGKLLGEEIEAAEEYVETERPDFTYYYKNDTTTSDVERYLKQVRGIDTDIINYLIDNEFLYQDQFKNCIFTWKENGLKSGKVVGANLQGTVVDYEKWGERGTAKFEGKNSRLNYGFNITIGEQPKDLYFFEATPDLLSYWSEHKDLKNCRLISMDGLKKSKVLDIVQENYQTFGLLPDNVYYGVDNDAAGHQFYDTMDMTFNFKSDNKIGVATNVKLIPYDTQLTESLLQSYQQAAEAHSVEWEFLASIHKAETNQSLTTKAANGFNFHGYFSEAPTFGPKEEQALDLQGALTHLAEDMTTHQLTVTDLQPLMADMNMTESEKLGFQSKVSYYYDRYKSGDFESVIDVQKDWNDHLKELKSEGVVTERVKLIAKGLPETNRLKTEEKEEQFHYYLSNHDNTKLAEDYLIRHNKFDPTIVQALISKGMIRQDSNERVVFVWGDHGKVVGGQIQGTVYDKKAFGRAGTEKKVMDNSLDGKGFNISIGKPTSLYFFQTPKDLLGFWTLYRDQLKDATLYSLASSESAEDPGHCLDIISEKLSEGVDIKKVSLCIQNNSKGLEFLDQFSQLDAYKVEEKGLMTKTGNLIALKSNRPKLGTTWHEELLMKEQRVEKVQQFSQYFGKTSSQEAEQTSPMNTPERQFSR